MEPALTGMDIDITQSHPSSADPLPFARNYQLEALEKALKENTIVFLETGSGKTLVAIMLLRSYAFLLRKPSPFIAVFLVPKVVLVAQQGNAVKLHTDLKVGMFSGDMGVDFWDAARWREEIDNHEVFVMTPQILLNGLRHSFLRLDFIKVLIFDECHHARGNDPYACIMTEFYHCQLNSGNSDLPRIFGMTASPIKSKGAKSEEEYWKKIQELENMMHSKVYTCVNEAELSQFKPFSTPKLKYYKHLNIPHSTFEFLVKTLNDLKEKHEGSLEDCCGSSSESTRKKILKVHSSLMYCLDELGVWLAWKAAIFLSCYESDYETDFLLSDKLDVRGEKIVKNISLDASMAFASCARTGSKWCIGDDIKSDVKEGLLTTKVVCLIDSLLEYRELKDLRCIIFVQRVITAVVLKSLLNELLPKHNSWKTKYVAGNNCGLQSQTRKSQNEIVEQFREGTVNIIVATSILEEGLDVQSCNLVIRFDPSETVCSFIQSRGRARMQNSDYVLMVKSGDVSTISRLSNYIHSGDIMKKESLRHASIPCSPLRSDLNDDEFYRVQSTGATVNLNSSVSLMYFYCSRLPSDRYFKPAPRFLLDKVMGTCTLCLPMGLPIQSIFVQGNAKTLKQKACLEACKQLHKIGALTDNLVPDIVVEEAVAQHIANEPYDDDQPIYFPPELVSHDPRSSETKYYCYLIELSQHYDYDVPVCDVVLVIRSELESDILSLDFSLETDKGLLQVKLKYIGQIRVDPTTGHLCRRFQIILFKVLMDQNLSKMDEVLKGLEIWKDVEVDYFLLPSTGSSNEPCIDWKAVTSFLFLHENVWKDHWDCPLRDNTCVVQTKGGPVCKCMLQDSLVWTPHNDKVYCITDIFHNLNANSPMTKRDGRVLTYKNYYEMQYGIKLSFEQESLLKARHIFLVRNYLGGRRQQKDKESRNAYVELPPELCRIIMHPISVGIFYSFTFLPSIMHRLESLLLAFNLKKMHLDHCMQNVIIPTNKVLEAITTKKCQEKFNLESLEALGDSFLKYAVCQQLFKTNQNHHEGLLSARKDKIVSNAALCKLGCDCKLAGFIRNESFDPKSWMVPGDNSLNEEVLSNERRIYVKGRQKVKGKKVADVVEALIGAYLSTGGETAGLLFLNWIGIEVDFVNIPYERHFKVQPEKFVNVQYLQSLLNYSFNDPSLLMEALTHGSYMLADIPGDYQRLEFLGDSVLDYLITVHLYNANPGMSPGLLTDMRSASVNNDCYALSSVKRGLHKHILYVSQELHKHIKSIGELPLASTTFGWESETSFPKVLGDVIESLAGAILVDSGYNKEVVFRSIRPLLEPLITPETVRFHPVRELHELCSKHHFVKRKVPASRSNGMSSVPVVVEAKGRIFSHTATAADKKTAEKVASKVVLRALKEILLSAANFRARE